MYCQIAIDGPAGAGKSTIAKIAASRLGYVYIDTGAMYRAMGLFFDRNGKWPEKSEDIRALSDKADISISNVDGVQKIYLNNEDVSEAIRTEKAGMSASRVSALPEVREKLVELQQKLAKSADVVMDGRDIGTVVLPDATLKIFLTADVHVRAKRRLRQLEEKGVKEDILKIEEDLKSRDHNDSTREASPLRQADDAVLLDTSDMTIEETADAIISLLKERKGV
jgi:cytidylate kinase